MSIGSVRARAVGVALAALCWLAPAALAQVGGEPAAVEAPTDFRGKVTLAYGLVFIFVVVFLVISHRRNAALREEIAFLERRLGEIEARGRGTPAR